jgi:minimal PKS acyl carrier protein
MKEMTQDEFKGFLLRAVGDDDSIDLSGDIRSASFAELGFDSLAIIDATAKIEQHYQIKLPESQTAGAATAGEFLDLVNGELAVA